MPYPNIQGYLVLGFFRPIFDPEARWVRFDEV